VSDQSRTQAYFPLGREQPIPIEQDAGWAAEPVWDPGAHPTSWRAVWAYSRSRAVRDTKTLTAQENRARDVITGGTAARTPRFVKTAKGRFVLDEAALARARRLVGLKGYATNIPAAVMPAAEVISSYHDLWHVERSKPQCCHSRGCSASLGVPSASVFIKAA